MSSFFLICFCSGCKRINMGEKKIFSTRIDDDLVRKLKHLAVDENKSLGNLLEEAIQELLKKYDKKSKK